MDSSCCCSFLLFFLTCETNFYGDMLTSDQQKYLLHSSPKGFFLEVLKMEPTKTWRTLTTIWFFVIALSGTSSCFQSPTARGRHDSSCTREAWAARSFFFYPFCFLFHHLRQVKWPALGIQACSRRLYPRCNRVGVEPARVTARRLWQNQVKRIEGIEHRSILMAGGGGG